MTFVDHAELIWRKVEAGQGQQDIAKEIGWERGQVAKYAALEKLRGAVWDAIVPTLWNEGLFRQGEGGTSAVPAGTSFTENLLRAILPLTPAQQLALVQRLIRGSSGRGLEPVPALMELG